MARINKKHEEHENHERWLITYADLITLLLIFFVILYSMSKIDVAKYTELSKSLAFQFKKSETIIPNSTLKVVNLSQPNPEKELKDLMENAEKYINDNKLDTEVAVKDTARGIAITLNDLFLFDAGRADLKPASIPILEKLSSLFLTLNAPISIEGHTDNQPLRIGSFYKDNDELASARSISVKRIFDKIPALHNKLSGAYYGDTRPIAPNDTPANMQKNRRVEIIVLREY